MPDLRAKYMPSSDEDKCEMILGGYDKLTTRRSTVYEGGTLPIVAVIIK